MKTAEAEQSYRFTHPYSQLQSLAADILHHAKTLGASDAVAYVSESNGLSVSVRNGETETIEHHRSGGATVTVYIGKRRGNASTADCSPAALRDAVAAAYHIARFTATDDASGPAEAELLETAPRDLDLHHPWELSVEDATEIARRAEDAAFAVNPQIRNSNGADVSTYHAQFALATSRGFMGGYPASRHAVMCAPIASDGAGMQIGHWHTSQRRAVDLATPEAVGRYAARRALARLGGRCLDTCRVPVLFEAPLATALLSTFVRAVSGAALYQKATFLADSLGRQVFAPLVQIVENPHMPRAMASAPFDGEGVRTHARSVVKDGVLEGCFLSTYSARKLGMQTTGHAGGPHNLSLRSSMTRTDDDLDAMLKKLGTGLFVTNLMGDGVNLVTGDYSRGASGFWVENGVIQYPVEGITIAGTLQQMFRDVVAIGADTIIRGSAESGSVLIGEMTVAGR